MQKAILQKDKSRWRVLDYGEDIVKATRAGGGWVQNIPRQLFDKRFRLVDDFTELLQECRTTVVGIDQFFPCRADPRDRWNGWAKPYFDDDIIREVIDALGREILHQYANKIEFEEGIALKSKKGWSIPDYCWELEQDV